MEWVMYMAMWLALVLYVAFAVGTTYLLCKLFLKLLPDGEKQDDEV